MAKKIYRVDFLEHDMNCSKEQKVWQLLRHWRNSAPLVASEQWRLFFTKGSFDKFYTNKALSNIIGNANITNDLRHQVVGILEGYISNISNNFRKIISKSNLSPDLRHQLFAINKQKAWYRNKPVYYHALPANSLSPGTSTPATSSTPNPAPPKYLVEISPEARALARSIMREIFKRRKNPSYRRIGIIAGKNLCGIKESADTSFPLWINLTTKTKHSRVQIPLLANSRYFAREGQKRKAVQISEQDGQLKIGLFTDVASVYSETKTKYKPRTKILALDFGLNTLFATDQGNLLGRRFIDQLIYYDKRISSLAAYNQSHELKVKSARYDKEVAVMRAFIKNEINRVFNQLVKIHQPDHLVLERLNFQNSNLSRRMNRLLQNCGRSIIKAKLKDLEEKYGITHMEVNPAYSSQECHKCGYIDKLNRKKEEFKCLFCGKTSHADINAAKTLRPRRSWPDGGIYISRQSILLERVKSFCERQVGWWSAPADPRVVNPYFKGYPATFGEVKDKYLGSLYWPG